MASDQANPSSSFNVNYPYWAYTTPFGAWGGIPGPLQLPPSTYQQAVSAVPEIAQNNAAGANLINSELMGALTPAMRAQLQDSSASWGSGSGLGFGSGLGQDNWDTSRLLSTIGYQNMGLNNSLNFNQGLEAGMLNPALESEIQQINSTNAAAPLPVLTWEEQQKERGSPGIGGLIGSIAGGILGAPFGASGQGAQIGNALGGAITGTGSYSAGQDPYYGSQIAGAFSKGGGGGGSGGMFGMNGTGFGGMPATPYGGSNAIGFTNPGMQNWYQNPGSDPFNALIQGPGGGTGQYADPFSGINDVGDLSAFTGLV